MKDDCTHRAKHIEKGWIIIDVHRRPLQPDGRNIPLSGGPTTKMRMDALNGIRPEQPVVSTSQSLIGRPGVLQLNHSMTYQIPDQRQIKDELEKFDLNDLVQYIATRSGQSSAIEETQEKGFPRVQ
jgi:hypothetical protein